MRADSECLRDAGQRYSARPSTSAIWAASSTTRARVQSGARHLTSDAALDRRRHSGRGGIDNLAVAWGEVVWVQSEQLLGTLQLCGLVSGEGRRQRELRVALGGGGDAATRGERVATDQCVAARVEERHMSRRMARGADHVE